jgi:magnesium chelatase accessory protein
MKTRSTGKSGIPERLPRDWPHAEFSRLVIAGSLRWHVQVAGTGPTILLLHGTGSSAHSWADVFPCLCKEATVVVPDLPGHGYTAGARLASLSLPEIAANLDSLLDALQVPPVEVVAGHSAGAALAIRWAIGRAAPPRAIVGFAPSLVPPPALYTNLFAPIVTPIATSSLVTAWLASMGNRSRLVDSLLDSTRSRVPALQRARYARLFGDPAHVSGTMRFMASTDLPALLAAAEGFATPATFVLGTRDPWVPELRLRRTIARSFPAAKVEGWNGGHLVHEEEPVRAARLISEVLSGT